MKQAIIENLKKIFLRTKNRSRNVNVFDMKQQCDMHILSVVTNVQDLLVSSFWSLKFNICYNIPVMWASSKQLDCSLPSMNKKGFFFICYYMYLSTMTANFEYFPMWLSEDLMTDRNEETNRRIIASALLQSLVFYRAYLKDQVNKSYNIP